MLKKSGSGIILWAVDPFEGKIKPHSFEVRNLQTWIDGVGARIQPVYVLNFAISNHSTGSQVQLTAQKIADVEKAITSYLKDIGCKNTLSPKVLVTYDAPVGGVIEKLIQYSDKVDAEMIVVSSRGRKGFDRFVFGSFAETLLFQSRRPLYFLTHQNGTPTEERKNRILFPTDFSEHSEFAFEALLRQVAASDPIVILYYAISLPSSVVSGEGMCVIPDNYCSRQEQDAMREALKWIKKAASAGVELSFIVENVGVSSNIGSSIIGMAKRKAVRFIAMASNSGRIGSIFFGSIAREVFRTNFFPVWICGPQALLDWREKGALTEWANV